MLADTAALRLRTGPNCGIVIVLHTGSETTG